MVKSTLKWFVALSPPPPSHKGNKNIADAPSSKYLDTLEIISNQFLRKVWTLQGYFYCALTLFHKLTTRWFVLRSSKYKVKVQNVHLSMLQAGIVCLTLRTVRRLAISSVTVLHITNNDYIYSDLWFQLPITSSWDCTTDWYHLIALDPAPFHLSKWRV